MQDKETVDEAEEALTSKTDVISNTAADKKDVAASKKEPTKDGKFAFKKMKQPKKEKPDKNKPDIKKYEGEGTLFKAKLIGLESVSDARGDKMCQEAMQRLKLNVKNMGPHKRKIQISVSLQGIKIKEEKSGVVLYHHPVSLISYISQDITDARAFGYVFGSANGPHQFIAIKTEKPAFHVVLSFRDLFQTALLHKQKEIDDAKNDIPKTDSSITTSPDKEQKDSSVTSNVQDEQQPKNENIYFEVLLTEPVPVVDEPVDDLIGLQDELTQLQKGIEQMDTSIATATALNSEVPELENDPFDTSFVLGPKRDSFAVPMPTPVPIAAPAPASEYESSNLTANGDKYAVFSTIDSGPSIFEKSLQEGGDQSVIDLKDLEEEISRKAAPPKPPRTGKADPADLSLFADLDPLGKDRPYKDKTEFFQDVKNPPKKVLNDLVDPSKENRALDVNLLISSVPFPAEFEAPHVNTLTSSSLPNNIPANVKLSLVNGNGDIAYNSFGVSDTVLQKARSESEPANPHFFNMQSQYSVVNSSAKPLSSHQSLNGNCNMPILNHPQINTTSSSPIPIPSRNTNFEISNGNTCSPHSKSPQPYAESPSTNDYFIQNYVNSEDGSPIGYQNGLQMHYINGENGNGILSNSLSIAKQNNINGTSNSTVNHNGVSRPRPRPSLNKGGSVPNGGRTVSSHSLSSDSSSDYEMISRENMQSITNVLLSNGHRLRAQSLNVDSNNEKNIFAKKNDPFADDFFFSLPKKASHLTKAEIPEYV